MKKCLILFLLLASVQLRSQSVFGYWYGTASIKTSGTANNYLVEMVLQPEKGYVKGIINYYFKNIYRSLEIKGNYDANSRQLSLYNIPMTYFGSTQTFEVDCIMNLRATLRVAQAGSTLQGFLTSMPEYKYTCPGMNISMDLNADISKKDSVLKAISEFKENYQVWKPSIDDTLVSVATEARKVINYVTENEFVKRKKVITHEVEVESDNLQIDVYDNGEVDGDIISIFYNDQLILNSQKLTHKSIRLKLTLDNTKESNELAMFAENLGLIAPNTAYMVINDGKNTYEISLSSNLEKNATISIKRKKAD